MASFNGLRKCPFLCLDDTAANDCAGTGWATGWQQKLMNNIEETGDAAIDKLVANLRWFTELAPRDLAKCMLADVYFTVQARMVVGRIMTLCEEHEVVQDVCQDVLGCLADSLELLWPDVVEKIVSMRPDTKPVGTDHAIDATSDVWK